jgi:undecaprenyl-diphosphatase
MTTFQAIIYAIIQGLSEFLPISASGHSILFPYLVGWQHPTVGLMAGITLGSFLALLIYFRHDWASMISCFLQVIIFRKRPMTLDERLPLFIAVSSIPVVLASYYFHDRVNEIEWTPLLVAGVLAAAGLPLWIFDSWGRKIKGMFDWNWLDAGIVGLVQATAVIPGWDHFAGILLGASFLNYRREAAAKYAYFAFAPILFVRMLSGIKEISFGSAAPSADLSWLSFGVAFVIALFAGLLAIGAFMKHVQQKSINQYVIYRWILAAAVCSLYWVRSRNGI